MNKLAKLGPTSMAERLPTQQGCRWGYVGPSPPTIAARRAFDREWDRIDWRSDAQGDWGFLDIDGSKWAVYVTEGAYAYFECRKGPPRPTFEYGDYEPEPLPPPPSRQPYRHPMAHLYGTGSLQNPPSPDQIFPTKKAPKRQGW